MLASSGLSLPLAQLVAGTAEDKISSYTTILALDKLQRTAGQAVKTTIQLEHDGDNDTPTHRSSVLDFPKSVFKLQPNADNRFKQFLTKYHVSTRAISRLVMVSDAGDDSEQKQTMKASSAPRWMLVTKLNFDPFG